jgi:hypothetical protein
MSWTGIDTKAAGFAAGSINFDDLFHGIGTKSGCRFKKNAKRGKSNMPMFVFKTRYGQFVKLLPFGDEP